LANKQKVSSHNEGTNTNNQVEATPTTKAFMEPLRGMYSTAQNCGSYDLGSHKRKTMKVTTKKLAKTTMAMMMPFPVPFLF
jgi:hypothetical protein